jgi:hypothetical protein
LVTAACTPATFSSLRATKTTSYPDLAKTSTMPLAIVPVPTTPTLRMSRRAASALSAAAPASAARRVVVEALSGLLTA